MNKFVLLPFAILALTGCGIPKADAQNQDQAQDMAKVQASLPSGCKLHYAGSVRVEGFREIRPSRVFFTVCGDVTTTSQTNTVTQGKTTFDQNDVAVSINK